MKIKKRQFSLIIYFFATTINKS